MVPGIEVFYFAFRSFPSKNATLLTLVAQTEIRIRIQISFLDTLKGMNIWLRSLYFKTVQLPWYELTIPGTSAWATSQAA